MELEQLKVKLKTYKKSDIIRLVYAKKQEAKYKNEEKDKMEKFNFGYDSESDYLFIYLE